MSYRVIVQRLAREDLLRSYRWLAKKAPLTAASWLSEQSLQKLSVQPQRCALAREAQKSGLELREFHVGRRRHAFRVIFLIDVDSVRILRIRRGQRRWLTKSEISESLEDRPEDS